MSRIFLNFLGKCGVIVHWWIGDFRYGEIREVFLDGAKGKNATEMDYFFDSWFKFIHQLQPKAVIFSDSGPDSRWVGNEAGAAASTCWSLFNQNNSDIGHTNET